jgi:hypothetical protein
MNKKKKRRGSLSAQHSKEPFCRAEFFPLHSDFLYHHGITATAGPWHNQNGRVPRRY